MKKIAIFGLGLILLIISNNVLAALSPSIVYKTKKDYSNNVSVCYSYKDNKISCYPGPSDVVHQRPEYLGNDYWFQKMAGNVFLKVSIDEFVKIGNNGDWFQYISIDNILDSDPFLEVYSCKPGSSVQDIKKIVQSGKIKSKCEDITSSYKIVSKNENTKVSKFNLFWHKILKIFGK